MKQYLLFFCLLICTLIGGSLQAQSEELSHEEVHPCATPIQISPWMEYYAMHRTEFENNDSIYYVPLSIHIVTDDNGESGYNENLLFLQLCQVNKDFEDANMRFYIEGKIRYIADSEFFIHNTTLEGAQFMFQYNVPNTVNIYFVGRAAGSAGYNLNYAGIAIQKNSAGVTSHTFTHELGHHFSVQHPFLGWEGGIWHDGSKSHSFNVPAPETVLYDYTYFKDTLILDTMIIDTALVERVDRSNCNHSADGFCDTPPDYLAFRWNCNQDGLSDEEQTDPDGQKFRSDGSFFMSYANDACQNRFSDEQIAAMRASLTNERDYLLFNQMPGNLITEQAQTVYPADNDTIPSQTTTELRWRSVADADYYIVNIASFPNGLFPVASIITVDTILFTDLLEGEETYYWTVTPFSNYSFCSFGSFQSTEASFYKEFIVNTRQQLQALSAWQVFPNPTSANSRLQIEAELLEAQEVHVQITDMMGKNWYSKKHVFTAGSNRFSLPAPPVAGQYLVSMFNEEGLVHKRVAIY